MPPELKQAAMIAASGSAVMMTRLLKLQGIQDADTLIPELQGGINEQQRLIANLQSLLASPQQGGTPMGQGSPQPQGMGAPMGAGVGPSAPPGLVPTQQQQQFGGAAPSAGLPFNV
jgi:hypothetical protein